jgi:tripartite-type tricarboxylate transporter receptor subunit TctC
MMNASRRRRTLAFGLSLATAGMASLLTAPAVMAQGNYPNKPITIVVAYPAGGDTDALARMFAEKLQERLKQTVVIDNKPGASGVIGSAYVAKAPADGYTLLLAPNTFAIAQYVLKTSGSSSYDVLGGFAPIIEADTLPMFLVASAASPFKSVQDVVEASKKGDLSYATPGSGSPMHVLGEMANKATGAKVVHVPYRGVAPAINDVLGGQVPLTYITLGPVAPHLPGGKLRLLAVASEKRSPLAPDVPTFAEQGYKGLNVEGWHGLFAPKGTPAEVVALLNRHMNEIIKLPDVQPRMNTWGAMPTGGTPEALQQNVAQTYQRFGGLIKEFGIQAD